MHRLANMKGPRVKVYPFEARNGVIGPGVQFNHIVTSTKMDEGHDNMNTEQAKVRYSDKFAIRMFAIQIPTVQWDLKSDLVLISYGQKEVGLQMVRISNGI